MVEEHIKHLLREHDCVIIPDFGGLISHYVPARIQPVKHTLAPPSRRIAFNEKLKVNDGLLISSLAQEHRLPAETARRQVADFVRELQEELREKYKYEMRGIGLFRLNADGNVAFEYIETVNLLDESFGLPELVARPILASPPVKMRNLFQDQPAKVQTEGRKGARSRLTRLYKVAAALVIGGVTFSGLYYLSSQTDYTLSSLNPMSFFVPEGERVSESQPVSASLGTGVQLTAEEVREMYHEFYPTGLRDELLVSKYAGEDSGSYDWEEFTEETEGQLPENGPLSAEEWSSDVVASTTPPAEDLEGKVSKPAEKEVAVGKTEKPAAVPAKAAAPPAKKETASVVSAKSGRFYIIIGGFSTREKAEEIREGLVKKGRNAKIILPTGESQLHRVSVADFGKRESAVEALDDLKPTYGTSIWVLNY